MKNLNNLDRGPHIPHGDIGLCHENMTVGIFFFLSVGTYTWLCAI